MPIPASLEGFEPSAMLGQSFMLSGMGKTARIPQKGVLEIVATIPYALATSMAAERRRLGPVGIAARNFVSQPRPSSVRSAASTALPLP